MRGRFLRHWSFLVQDTSYVMSPLYAATENTFFPTPSTLENILSVYGRRGKLDEYLKSSEKAALEKGDKCFLTLPRSDFQCIPLVTFIPRYLLRAQSGRFPDQFLQT